MNLFYGSDGQVTGKESNWTPKITTKRFFVDFLIYRNMHTLFLSEVSFVLMCYNY